MSLENRWISFFSSFLFLLMIGSPQANLPSGPSGAVVRIAVPTGSQLQPRIIALDGSNAAYAFHARDNTILPDRLPVKRLLIRNINNVKVYYAKNTIASATAYHGILSAATGSADGTGGEVDLADDQPAFVTVFASATALVVVDVIYEDSI